MIVAQTLIGSPAQIEWAARIIAAHGDRVAHLGAAILARMPDKAIGEDLLDAASLVMGNPFAAWWIDHAQTTDQLNSALIAALLRVVSLWEPRALPAAYVQINALVTYRATTDSQ